MKNQIILLFLLLSLVGYSQQDYTINNYDIVVKLDENGSAHFTETIDVKFHRERRGIFRTIQLEGNFVNHQQKISIDDVRVDDWKFKVTEQGDELEIRIGDKDIFITGPQQYVIKYTAHNGILNFANHEEFFWTLIGPDWDTNINNVSFKIELPTSLELQENDLRLFAGENEATSSYGEINQIGNDVVGRSLATLGKDKGLTVAIKFPKAYFFKDPNTKLAKEIKPKPADRIFALPIILILGLFFSFYKLGRNRADYDPTPSYYPPLEMSPSEVGTRIDFQANRRDLISLIPYWGEKGFIKMRADQNGKKADLFLEKINDIPTNVPEHESYFFQQLFATGDIVFIEDLNESFYLEFAKASKLLSTDALQEELFDQKAKKLFHSNWMFLFASSAWAIGVVFIALMNWLATGLLFIAFGLCLIVVRYLRVKRSEKGQELYLKLDAFRDTLKNPDSKMLLELTEKDPRYFEKVFPYVVAFGLDKEWIKSFKDISTSPPDWYYYGDGYQGTYADFGRHYKTNHMTSNMAVPPQAPGGSSSFGGGGSVGGGFGGGGGGSW